MSDNQDNQVSEQESQSPDVSESESKRETLQNRLYRQAEELNAKAASEEDSPEETSPEEVKAKEPEVVESEPEEPVQETQVSEEPTKEEDKFSPDYKYKFLGKEYEVDEFLRGAITNEEQQKVVRDLYEKARGLDIVKPKYQETRDKYKELQQEYDGFSDRISRLNKLYEEKDFEVLFKELGIDEQKALQYFVDKLNYEQMPDEQKQAVDAQWQYQRKLRESEDSKSELAKKQEDLELQVLATQMTLAFNEPRVKEFATWYDSLPGQQAGMFQKEVLDYGDSMARSGNKVTAQQAVDAVVARYDRFRQQSAPVQTPANPAAQPQAQAPVAQQAPGVQPKVIPNVRGRSTSPLKSKPRRLADLEKIAESLGPSQSYRDTYAT